MEECMFEKWTNSLILWTLSVIKKKNQFFDTVCQLQITELILSCLTAVINLPEMLPNSNLNISRMEIFGQLLSLVHQFTAKFQTSML